jgi:hypothetical protein
MSNSQKSIFKAAWICLSRSCKLELLKSWKKMNLQLLSSSGLLALKCLLVGTQDLLTTANLTCGSPTPSLWGKVDSKKIMEGYLFATKVRAAAPDLPFSTDNSLMSAQVTPWRNACKTKSKLLSKKRYLSNRGLSKFNRQVMSRSECYRKSCKSKKRNTLRKNTVLMTWKPCLNNKWKLI